MSHHLPPELLDVWNHVYANNAEMFAANLSRSRSICRSTQYTILYRLTSLRLNHLLINSTGDRLYPVYLQRIIRVNDFSMCPFWIQKFLPECKALEEALKLIVLIGDKSHTYDCNCSVCGRHPAPDMENIPLLKQALKHPKWSVSYSPSRRWKRTPHSWSRRWKRKGRKLWRPLLAFGSRRNAGSGNERRILHDLGLHVCMHTYADMNKQAAKHMRYECVRVYDTIRSHTHTHPFCS